MIIRTFLIACAAMSLTACATSGDAVPSGASQGTAAAVALNADKALWATEAAYNAPAQAYVAFDAKGALPASVKATVRPLLLKAFDGVKVARCAHSFVKLAAGVLTGVLPSGDLEKCPADARSQAALYNAKAEVEGLSAQASALLPK